MKPEPTGAVYRVRHHYRYVYTGPIHDVQQRLIMIPPDRHVDQRLLSFDLDVRGTSGQRAIDWQVDQFGNRVCRVQAEHVQHALDFEATFEVTRDAPVVDAALADSCPMYLETTGLTAPDDRIRAAARTIRAEATTPRERADLAHTWAARAITYQFGVTGTHTPAAMALHLGHGVCQDYAHIMLALLRVLDIPARYVSGHLLGEGAPHAWVEAFVRDAPRARPSLLAFDPTHHRATNMNYITVAVGRDFADVTPTSGVFTGAAFGKLHWSKHAQRLDSTSLGDGDEAAA